jgi:hypothetical protein
VSTGFKIVVGSLVILAAVSFYALNREGSDSFSVEEANANRTFNITPKKAVAPSAAPQDGAEPAPEAAPASP